MNKLTRDQIECKANRALDIISGLSNGRIKWTMRVPADELNDPDLVLAATIRDLRDIALRSIELIAQVERERKQLDGLLTATCANTAMLDRLRAAESRCAESFRRGAEVGAQEFSDMLCGLSNKPPHDVGTDRNALDHIICRMQDKYGSPAAQVERAARAALAKEAK